MDEDVRRGIFGLAPEGEPLPAEDVERLPEGARVVVIWSGGNGPHECVIAGGEGGQRYTVAPELADDPNHRMRWYNPLTFVGGERYHTRVWRVDR